MSTISVGCTYLAQEVQDSKAVLTTATITGCEMQESDCHPTVNSEDQGYKPKLELYFIDGKDTCTDSLILDSCYTGNYSCTEYTSLSSSIDFPREVGWTIQIYQYDCDAMWDYEGVSTKIIITVAVQGLITLACVFLLVFTILSRYKLIQAEKAALARARKESNTVNSESNAELLV